MTRVSEAPAPERGLSTVFYTNETRNSFPALGIMAGLRTVFDPPAMPPGWVPPPDAAIGR